MEQTAFVFSGQGDQSPGMGREAAQNYAAAAEVFALCDSIRPGTSWQCFCGREEELKITENTQPCLFAVEMAIAETLRREGIRPAAAAGFSLGEIPALTFAGAISLEAGFRLIMRRSQLMQSASEERKTFMAAVLRLENERVEEICSSLEDVYPVNYNCPGQISVAGAAEKMTPMSEAVRAAGGRLIPLKVSGGFHSPFMRSAAESFKKELDGSSFAAPQIRVYSNLTAQVYRENPADLLSQQIMRPVLWEQEIRNMIDEGITTFVEIGPGSTLTGLIRRIDRRVKACSASNLPSVIEMLRQK